MLFTFRMQSRWTLFSIWKFSLAIVLNKVNIFSAYTHWFWHDFLRNKKPISTILTSVFFFMCWAKNVFCRIKLKTQNANPNVDFSQFRCNLHENELNIMQLQLKAAIQSVNVFCSVWTFCTIAQASQAAFVWMQLNFGGCNLPLQVCLNSRYICLVFAYAFA